MAIHSHNFTTSLFMYACPVNIHCMISTPWTEIRPDIQNVSMNLNKSPTFYEITCVTIYEITCVTIIGLICVYMCQMSSHIEFQFSIMT